MADPTYRRVLLPLDGSVEAEAAFPPALAVARRFGSVLTLLRAADAPSANVLSPIDALRLAELEREAAVEYLANVAGWCGDVPTEVVTVQPSAPASEAIVRHAREIGADLIVMTSRGRSGIERLLLGSVADAVRRRAPCPVLIVPARARPSQEREESYRWILLALDGSNAAERAVPHAAAFARRFQASVSVVRAVAPAAGAGSSRGPGPHPIVLLAEHQLTAATYVARVADQLRQSGVHVRSEPIEGAADDVLVRRARMLPADLVVLTTRERGWIERLVLGSVTNGVLRRAICPVLIVPEHGKEDPRAA